MSKKFGKLFKWLTIVVLLFITLSSMSQSERDTLKANLKQLNNFDKIDVLNRLAETFKDDSIDVSLEYLLQAYQTAQKHGDNSIISNQAEKLADVYTQIGHYNESIYYYDIIINLSKKEGYSKKLSRIYRLLGNVYYYTGDYDKCLESHLESLRYAELDNNQGGIAGAYNNIGLINMKYEKYDIALDYFQRAEKVFAKIGNLTNQGMSIINIGNIYYYTNEYDNALGFYQRAYNIFEKTNEPKDIALAAQNISAIYDLKKDYKNAMLYADKALELYMKSNNVWGIIHLAQNIGFLYLDKDDFDKAEHYFKLSHENALQTNSLPLLISSYSSLSQLYEKKGEYEKAFQSLKNQYSIKDSLYKKETTEKLAELESKYQLDQKEKENNLLKRYFTYMSILAVLVVIVILFNYRLKVISNRQLRDKNKQIAKQNIELAEINATKNRFFSIIAHDLKNPLSAFIGIMEVFRLKLFDMPREEQQENLRQISLLAESMYNLLENLLKWGRSQVGALEFNPSYISLNKIVEDSIKVISWNAQSKGIAIENLLDSEITVFADENMVATITRNLLGNAVKFTPSGGKISVSVSHDNGNVSLYIKDNGVGISDEDQTKLFRIDSKFRTLGTANEPGTGLGLILCKEFAEMHGGNISVKSTVGQGSTFGFSIKTKP
jgi:signal transduction histidine kinase